MGYNFFLNLVTWCLGAILKRTGGQIGTFLSLSLNVLGLSLVISRGSRVKMICEGFMRDTSELGGGSVGIKWNGLICARLKLQLIIVTTVFKTFQKGECIE